MTIESFVSVHLEPTDRDWAAKVVELLARAPEYRDRMVYVARMDDRADVERLEARFRRVARSQGVRVSFRMVPLRVRRRNARGRVAVETVGWKVKLRVLTDESSAEPSEGATA